VTTIQPDVAPVGIVMLIEVLLQEFTVTGTAFSVTKLGPRVAPKLSPVMVTWLPIGPVVTESPVIAGAGLALELTETLSNVAEFELFVFVLLTPSPTTTFWPIFTVTGPPTGVQLLASGEAYPTNVLPLRTSLIQ
jgi:hypothetical protein